MDSAMAALEKEQMTAAPAENRAPIDADVQPVIVQSLRASLWPVAREVIQLKEPLEGLQPKLHCTLRLWKAEVEREAAYGSLKASYFTPRGNPATKGASQHNSVPIASSDK